MAALTWGIVGIGALSLVAAAYWRLVEQERVRRGADVFRFRFFRVWLPLVMGVAALGKLPRALSAPFPIVALSDVLSLAPAVIVVGLGWVAARKPGPGARTTTAPDPAGNNAESR
ncbi:hypothetical protein ABZ490_50325 [Streptomyces sp. NPDC005811]|uniref:hypothetical protein n=1 Tax=Streptomyces sp. NPDC005811 TaxID=3154565 RepID=UPI0033C857AA